MAEKRKIKQSDKKWRDCLKKVVENDEQTVFSISVKEGHIVLDGSKHIVDHVLGQNSQLLTLEMLMNKMLLKDESTTFSTATPKHFPKFSVPFKSKDWKYPVAYQTLKCYLNILGFHNGSTKKFGRLEDRPQEWPDTESWEDFRHPCAAKIDKINKIISSILQFHQIDVKTHHIVQTTPPVVPDANEIPPDVPEANENLEIPPEIPPEIPVPEVPTVTQVTPSSSSTTTITVFAGNGSNLTRNAQSLPVSNGKRIVSASYSSDSDTSNNNSYNEESPPSDHDVAENEPDDDEEETVSEHDNNNLCEYELSRKRNIEEQRAMWQAILAAKGDLSPVKPKPSRKKRKTQAKPKPTSEYGLRKNPKKKIYT